MNQKARYLIENLELEPHKEGGYFKEIYRSDEILTPECLPERYTESRNLYTNIYFLLQEYDFSAFHKLQSDELWHFCEGDPINIYVLTHEGLQTITLGSEVAKGQFHQYLIKRGHWFAAELTRKDGYCLAGCTASPGFEYDDLELANRKDLINEFPKYAQIINDFTIE
jgi:hypothetical protein